MRLSKDDYINELNSSLILLQQQVDYVKLSSAYGHMTYEDARRNLTFHRMFKKFETPDLLKQETVKDKSVDQVFLDDENQSNTISRFTQVPHIVRSDIYKLRAIMLEDVSSVMHKFKVQITTGENVISRNGDTSVYSKLKNREAWTCSTKNINKAVRLILSSRCLKRMLVRHYTDLLWVDYIKRRGLLTIDQILALPRKHWYNFKKRHFTFMFNKYGRNVSKVITAFFKKVATFGDYARITTVPKDNEKARVIITCPFFDMLSQRDDAFFIKEVLRLRYGIQLDFTQQVQRNRIYDYNNSTVDFENASNSTLFDTVYFLLGESAFFKKHLNVSCARIVKYKNQWHKLNMFSPMGCGSTFELMTWILTAAARLYDKSATVFGDDVVIKRFALENFITMTSVLGYKVNQTKTFIDGHFRESCGAFVSHQQAIKCFDMEFAEDYASAVILTNKIRLIRHGIPELESLYNRLIDKLPLLTFKMAADDHPVLDDGVPTSDNLVRKQRKCITIKPLFQSLVGQSTYARRSMRITSYYVREVLSTSCETLWDKPNDTNVDFSTYCHYMYSLRVLPPTIRNTEHTTAKLVLCEINNNLPVTFE